MATIETGECAVGGDVSALDMVLATVREAMPALVEDGAVRVEEYLRAMRVVARCGQDALLVRVPSINARGAMVARVAELTRLVGVPGSGQFADEFVLMSLGGGASLAIGDRDEPLTPLPLSAVEPVVTTFPTVGTVAGDELLEVATAAQTGDEAYGVVVTVGGGGITFGAIAGAIPIAKVEVTNARQLAGDVEVFRLDADRVAALARRMGDGPIEVRFTFAHDGAFVALVSGDGLVEAQLHAAPVVR